MKNSLIKKYSFIQIRLLLIFLVPIFLNSCLSVKPSTTKSGKKYFETFYVGAEGSQYFIKPLLFKDNEANEELYTDFTFRYKNVVKDSAIVNFSIKSPVIYKSIDSLKISNSKISVKSNDIDLLFNEKTKKEFISRFTTKIALNEIKELFSNDDWEFIVYSEKQVNNYKPHKKTAKGINTLRDKVFILM